MILPLDSSCSGSFLVRSVESTASKRSTSAPQDILSAHGL